MIHLIQNKARASLPNGSGEKRSRENLRAAAKQLAAESIVLLANNHHFLPVKPEVQPPFSAVPSWIP